MSLHLSAAYIRAMEVALSMTPHERITLARVLYGHGYAPTIQCNEGTHHTMCRGCSCDCHLDEDEFMDLHGSPRD